MNNAAESAQAPRREEKDLFVRTDYKILYEDEGMLVLDKPAPLPVHPVGRFKERNLLSIVQKDLNLEGLRIVNRLDSETSGLVLAAKTKEAAYGLASQFEARTVHKEYAGIAFGVFTEKREQPGQAANRGLTGLVRPSRSGRIDTPLGYKIENNYHLRIPDPEGEEAVTDYEVLEESGRFSLLRLIPRTGRMHQIRAHLAFSGHPLAGDKIYINLDIYDRYVQNGWDESMLDTVKMPRLALHASSLRVRHPGGGHWMEFHSPPPDEFSDFFRSS